MADAEAQAVDEPERSAPDSDAYDPNGWSYGEPEIEWMEPGVDIWGWIRRVILRRPDPPWL
jgi:hypothetical protein